MGIRYPSRFGAPLEQQIVRATRQEVRSIRHSMRRAWQPSSLFQGPSATVETLLMNGD
jgi:hypothetical protein